jgi:hypothetical protein
MKPLGPEIEELLGRAISPDAAQSVETLNDLGPEMVAEARVLASSRNRLHPVRYLEYHVKVFHFGWGADFVDDVVVGGADASTWRIRHRLCTFHRSEKELASASVSYIVDKLAGVPGERWWRETPSRDSWGRDAAVGAPGVLIRSARYWLDRTLPDETWAIAVRRPIERIDPAAVPIAIRRWLASRFAWRASAYLAEARPSFEGLLSALSVSREALSEDALIAVRALIRESSLDPRSASLVPGFRGPDAWYAERGDEPAAER